MCLYLPLVSSLQTTLLPENLIPIRISLERSGSESIRRIVTGSIIRITFIGVDFAFLGLVVEDAPSGILAGHAAGAQVLAVCTSHSRQVLLESGANPDFIVEDLTR